jgi:alpha-glucosidase
MFTEPPMRHPTHLDSTTPTIAEHAMTNSSGDPIAVGPWWEQAVVYQIYPRSFADSDGDGVGDLQGIASRLDYLVDLGVDAIWLSPFYPSPMADFGYDVAEFCDVDPAFGSLADFDRLVAEAHERNLKVVVDYVPNHTSDRHPWFVASRSGRGDPKRSWYVWRDPAPDGGAPNNWRRAFSDEPAWTFDDATGQYYLHLFLAEQPDLDWNEVEVQQAMGDVLRFWMDRGVDGFRADVVHCIGKGPDLPDAPEGLAGLPACIFDHGPGTHEQIRVLRRIVDGDSPGEHLLLGETAVFDRDQQLSYLGEGDELHLGFNFLFLHAQWSAAAWRQELQAAIEGHGRLGAWPTWVLSNHDVRRHRTRYGSDARARAAAVALLSLRGTPFLYQGEELGLEDAVVPPERVLDPGGRDGCRAPIPWESDRLAGWPEYSWLPLPPDAAAHSVAAEIDDPGSMLSHYKRLLRVRRELEVLRSGGIELLDAPDQVVRWRRFLGDPGGDRGAGVVAEVEVAVNFGSEPVPDAMRPGRLVAGSRPSEEFPGARAGATLGPDEARIVVPE